MSAQDLAARFVHLVAQAHPEPGNRLDKTIVSVARDVSDALRREAGLPPFTFTSPSGVPITRRRT